MALFLNSKFFGVSFIQQDLWSSVPQCYHLMCVVSHRSLKKRYKQVLRLIFNQNFIQNNNGINLSDIIKYYYTEKALASPKSAILTFVISNDIRTFCGLISRCMIRLLCR